MIYDGTGTCWYLVVLRQYKLVLLGIKRHWVSIGLLCLYILKNKSIPFVFVGPLPRVRPRNGILALLVVVVPLRSEFIGEL